MGEDFEVFVRETEPRLRRALCAAYGTELGREATAEALAYAWEHWRRLQVMENPAGYLFRVGRSKVRRLRRRLRVGAAPEPARITEVEPQLTDALGRLSERQQAVVILVHGFDWSHVEVAEVLGLSPSSVATHCDRALVRLRAVLEVQPHA